MHNVKTKFDCHVSFGTTLFDTIPDADNNEGYIDIRTVMLNGIYTFDDLKAIIAEMKQREDRRIKFTINNSEIISGAFQINDTD